MQKDSDEEQDAQPGGNKEAGRDRHAVKKSVNRKPEKNRALRMAVLHLLGVRFFAKMKVRRNRMFEKMNQEESNQDVNERALAAQVNRFRYHFQKRHRKHVSRPERQKIL